MIRTRCAHCRAKFAPSRPSQIVHLECVEAWVVAQAEKRARADEKRARATAKVERAEIRRRKEAIKPRTKWLAEAKLAVQAFRREEELAKGRGCMSCKRTQQEVMSQPWTPGGYWDGGHFMSKGARPELALEPLNIWLQCKSCNAGGGKYARKGYTVNASYEANLIEAEGAALVEWLKGPHDPKHYTTEDLKEIVTTNRRKLRELKSMGDA